MTRVKRSDVSKRILQLLADEPGAIWGLEICRKLTLKPGTVYPILKRFEAAGWVTSEWETEPRGSKGPRRKLYRMSHENLPEMNEFMQAPIKSSASRFSGKPITGMSLRGNLE